MNSLHSIPTFLPFWWNINGLTRDIPYAVAIAYVSLLVEYSFIRPSFRLYHNIFVLVGGMYTNGQLRRIPSTVATMCMILWNIHMFSPGISHTQESLHEVEYYSGHCILVVVQVGVMQT